MARHNQSLANFGNNRWIAITLILFVTTSTLSTGLAFGDTSTTATKPEVTVTVNADKISRDETVLMSRDPLIRVQAEMPGGSNETLQSIIFEIDGSLYKKIEVPGTRKSITREISPSLANGKHTVTIIVKDSTGDITSFAFTVQKDTVPPELELTKPYHSDPTPDFKDGTIKQRVITVAGNIKELSGPTTIRIKRTHRKSGYTITNEVTANTKFSSQLELAYGVNQMRLIAEDQLGNTRKYEFTIELVDRKPPEITIKAPKTVRSKSTTIRVQIRDNLWVNKSSLFVGDTTFPNIVSRKPYNPSKNRRLVSFTKQISLQPGKNEITVTARDHLKKKSEKTIVIKRKPSKEHGYQTPNIDVSERGTNFKKKKRLFVNGTITGDKLTSATIEAVVPTNDSRVGYGVLYTGEPQERISISKQLSVGATTTKIIITAEDQRGNTTQTTFFVNGQTGEVFTRSESGEIANDTSATDTNDTTSADVTNDTTSADVTNDTTSADVTNDTTSANTSDQQSSDSKTKSDPKAPQQAVLLDTARQPILGVTFSGTTYWVYRYNNILPYASGIEVYANGKQVTDRETVAKVLRVVAAREILREEGINHTTRRASQITSESQAEKEFRSIAWRTAAQEIDENDIQTLRKLLKTSRQIERLVTPPLTALNTVLEVIDRLRDFSIAGVSAWDVATDASPTLKQFEKGAKELRAELQEWKTAANEVNQKLPKAIESLERLQNGKEVDYTTVSERFATSMAAIKQLQSKSNELSNRLNTGAERTSQIASALSAKGPLTTYAEKFDQVSNKLANSANQVDSFSDRLENQQQNMGEVRQTARSKQSELLSEWRSEHDRLMNNWKSRQSAKTKVYGTGGVAGVVVLLILLRLVAH